MFRPLSEVRVGRASLAILAIVSGIATAVILLAGGGRSQAELAAMAELRAAPTTTVVRTPAPAPADLASTGTIGSGGAPGGGDGGGDGSGSAGSSGGSTGGSPAASGASGASGSASGTQGGSSGSSAGSGDGASSGTGGSGTGATGTSGSGAAGGGAVTTAANPNLPPVRHVFLIVLPNPGISRPFGTRSPLRELARVRRQGTLLSGLGSLGAGPLADEIALVSGQPPNPDTRSACPAYAEFPTGTSVATAGVLRRPGCVFPETVLTLGDQVSASGHVWRAFVQDMSSACAHPASDGSSSAAIPGAGPGYSPELNPFIYFHSLLDLGDCESDDLDLGHLAGALGHVSATPTLAYLTPDVCAVAGSPVTTSSSTTTTASPTTTTTSTSTTTTAAASDSGAGTAGTGTDSAGCPGGSPTGVPAEQAFLAEWLPRIMASAAYRRNGLLIVTFAGGSRTRPAGALVLSRYAHRDATVRRALGPYSVLRSLEDVLGVTPLGEASSAPSFATSVLARPR